MTHTRRLARAIGASRSILVPAATTVRASPVGAEGSSPVIPTRIPRVRPNPAPPFALAPRAARP